MSLKDDRLLNDATLESHSALRSGPSLRGEEIDEVARAERNGNRARYFVSIVVASTSYDTLSFGTSENSSKTMPGCLSDSRKPDVDVQLLVHVVAACVIALQCRKMAFRR